MERITRRTLLVTGMASGAALLGTRSLALAADEPQVEIRKDVPYLPAGRTEKLDLYLPAGRPAGTRSPAVVIIHGGGWRGGDKGASREINIGTNLARAGYVCASINYRLIPASGEMIWPQNLHDCKNAVRYLRTHAEKYGIDPEHVGGIGGSAGGHLALMVGFTSDHPTLSPQQPYPGVSDRVQAIVDMYGAPNLLTRQETDAEGNPTGKFKGGPETLLGGTREQVPERWREASPVFHLTKDAPPVLILHGKKDTTVDRDQSIELAARLKEMGVEHRLELIDGVGHTFDLQTWARKPLPYDLRPMVIGFFDRHLKPE